MSELSTSFAFGHKHRKQEGTKHLISLDIIFASRSSFARGRPYFITALLPLAKTLTASNVKFKCSLSHQLAEAQDFQDEVYTFHVNKPLTVLKYAEFFIKNSRSFELRFPAFLLHNQLEIYQKNTAYFLLILLLWLMLTSQNRMSATTFEIRTGKKR